MSSFIWISMKIFKTTGSNKSNLYLMVQKISLTIFVSLFFFSSCKKEAPEGYSNIKLPTLSFLAYNINGYNGFYYHSIPINFVGSVNTSDLDMNSFNTISYLWDFGDGNTSNTRVAPHAYDSVGIYNIVFSVAFDGDTVKHTESIEVKWYPRVLKKTSAPEYGAFLYQEPNGTYNVFYRDLRHNYYFDKFNDTSLTAITSFRSDENMSNIIMNNNNHLVFVCNNYWKEIALDGTQIYNRPISECYSSVMNHHNGYLLVGGGYHCYNFEEGNVRLLNLNFNGNKISLNDYDFSMPGYRLGKVELLNSQNIILNYIDSLYIEGQDVHTIIKSINTDTLLNWVMEYDFSSTYHIKELHDGYLLYGINYSIYDGEEFQLTKIDTIGQVIWHKDIDIYAPYYSSSLALSVFEDLEGVVIFFDNMRGVKFDHQGEIIWEKFYALHWDSFSYAIKNNRGNYVLLGEQHFDFERNMISLDHSDSDLIVIEIDQNGEPIK